MRTQNLFTRFFGMKENGPDPFGAPLVIVGEGAEGNPFRFWTKYTDDESGLVYYGYRYYAPGMGRWLCRDPIGEWAARNPYGFVSNAPVSEVDPLGQLSLSDLKKLQDAMKAFKDCHDKMVSANKTAREWWNGVATKRYICCVNGKTVPIEDFPGVLTGDSQSKHGVLHCALGVDARANGVSEGCIFAANVLWEFKEVVDPHYWEWLPWKKGSWGWLKDTISDMDEVFNAYFNVKTKEGCIPSQCTKTK